MATPGVAIAPPVTYEAAYYANHHIFNPHRLNELVKPCYSIN